MTKEGSGIRGEKSRAKDKVCEREEEGEGEGEGEGENLKKQQR